MADKTRIPLQYKFLLPTILAAGAAFSWSLWILRTSLTQDKLRFATDTNSAVLKSAIAESNAAFKLRFYELQSFVPQLYRQLNRHASGDPFVTLPTHLREELIGISFYQPRRDGTFAASRIPNNLVVKGENTPEGITTEPNREHPLDLETLEHQHELRVLNRSYQTKTGEPALVYSLVLFGQAVDGNPQQTIIVADILGDFARAALRRSELTEVFLLNQDGSVFAHANPDIMAEFAGKPWKHPSANFASDGGEATGLHWNFGGRSFTAALNPTALPQVVAISQTADTDLTKIFRLLERKTALAVLGLWFTIAFIVVFFASRISRNLRAVTAYLDDFAAGRQSGFPKINAWDEIAELAAAARRLAKELPNQLQDAVQRGRKDSENALSHSLRTTLAAVPQVIAENVEVISHRPEIATCVDFWDSYSEGHTITLMFGRTNDYGVGAAMFTAYAKSCLATMRTVHRRVGGKAIPLVQQAQMLNDSLYLGYKGRHQLLLTMLEIDLRTGDCQVINAGGEAPFCLTPTPMPGDNGFSSVTDVRKPEQQVSMHKEFAAIGAPIGAQPTVNYQTVAGKLEKGEQLFLFTHNKWRAKDAKEATEGRQRVKHLLATSYHPTPQAMALDVTAKNPFGDEMSFWIVEWRTAMIQRPSAPTPLDPLKSAA